ncbi:hypothetical protein CYY_000046 [Polysphondylium violaceum]|uniref:Nucleolus and neural progenitor protein-like N-terminal domain-containing protein n=1 Tax=Polysphondylium violaceum TaxID=133409 RepID=A0A8J4V2S0_9MYCE|nr:hypothetical protein CYY_000046 [Polysphondylium violaceum]
MSSNDTGLKKIASSSILSLVKQTPLLSKKQPLNKNKNKNNNNNNNNDNNNNNNNNNNQNKNKDIKNITGIKRENGQINTPVSDLSSSYHQNKKQKKSDQLDSNNSNNNNSRNNVVLSNNKDKDTKKESSNEEIKVSGDNESTTTTTTLNTISKKEERKFKAIINNITSESTTTINFIQEFDKLFYCPNIDEKKKKKDATASLINHTTKTTITEINEIISNLSTSFQVPTDIVNELTLFSKIISRYSTIQRKFISYKYLKFSKKKIQKTYQLLQSDEMKKLFDTLTEANNDTTNTRIPSKEFILQLIVYLNTIYDEIILTGSVMMEGGNQIGKYLIVGHFAKLSMLCMACLAKIHTFFQSVNQSIINASLKLAALSNSLPRCQ